MKKLILLFLVFLIMPKFILAAEIMHPSLIIKSADGKNFDLEKQLGKVVIVNFWVSWCGECQAEMVVLKELYSQYRSQGLEIVGISIDRKKDRDIFSKISEKLSYPNFMLVDAKANQFGEPNSLPTTYIIDRKGNVVKSDILQQDEISKKDFEKILHQIL